MGDESISDAAVAGAATVLTVAEQFERLKQLALRRALLGFRDALLLLQFEPLGARGLPGPRYSQKRYRVNREIASHFPRPSP